jgi:hypothetical protein
MDHMLVDAMTVRMTLHPETLDTILATNLHADILSDLAAGELRRLFCLGPELNSVPQYRSLSWFHRDRPDCQHRPLQTHAFNVRTYPRFGVRHRWTRSSQPCRHFLDGLRDA